MDYLFQQNFTGNVTINLEFRNVGKVIFWCYNSDHDVTLTQYINSTICLQ